MSLHKKIIPTYFVESIKDIDYNGLKEQGVKALFFDLDNTLIPYDIDLIPVEVQLFLEELKKDFKIVVVSNSRKKRVKYATSKLVDIPFVKFARKPFKFGFKKALKYAGVQRHEAAAIGDQLMTDVFGGNRLNFKVTVLVYPIKKKSEHIFTRFNRRLENHFIKKVAKKQPEKYEEVLKKYVERK